MELLGVMRAQGEGGIRYVIVIGPDIYGTE
jgi:hypothetical protein